jgi:hypothetical protein
MRLPSFFHGLRNRFRTASHGVRRTETSPVSELTTSHAPANRSNPPTYTNPPTYRSLPSYRGDRNEDLLVMRGQEGLSREAARISHAEYEILAHGGLREDGHAVPAFLLEEGSIAHAPQRPTVRRRRVRPNLFEVFNISQT